MDKQKINSMCKDCARYGRSCAGTANKTYTGCIYRKRKTQETDNAKQNN